MMFGPDPIKILNQTKVGIAKGMYSYLIGQNYKKVSYLFKYNPFLVNFEEIHCGDLSMEDFMLFTKWKWNTIRVIIDMNGIIKYFD